MLKSFYAVEIKYLLDSHFFRESIRHNTTLHLALHQKQLSYIRVTNLDKKNMLPSFTYCRLSTTYLVYTDFLTPW
jgi:hypothetical protein